MQAHNYLNLEPSQTQWSNTRPSQELWVTPLTCKCSITTYLISLDCRSHWIRYDTFGSDVWLQGFNTKGSNTRLFVCRHHTREEHMRQRGYKGTCFILNVICHEFIIQKPAYNNLHETTGNQCTNNGSLEKLQKIGV